MENNQPVVPPRPNQVPVVPQSPPPPDSPPGPNSKKRTILLVGGFLIVILLFGYGIYLFFSQNVSPSSSVPTPTPAISVAPSSSIPTGTQSDGLILLKKNIKTPVPQTTLELTFTGKETPADNCNDCYSTTNVQIKNGNKNEKISFFCGGISGTCERKADSMGYSFELVEDVESDQIKVLVKIK